MPCFRLSYSAFCWFPFVLPCFAPAAVPQVIPFQISPPGPVLDFRLSFVRFRFSASLLGLCFFLSSFFPFPPHSGFSVRPFRSRFLAFPRSFWPGFPCLLSRFFVLGFLFVSFHPSRFRSHSRSTGASLLFRFLSSASLPGFQLAFRFLSSASACL